MRFFLLLAALLAFPAWGQTIAKPVRVIVPFPAGGGTDVLARIVAEKLRGGYAPAGDRRFGMRAQTLGSATFGAMLRADLERWAPVVKASGFTAED